MPDSTRKYPRRINGPRDIINQLRRNAWTETVARYRKDGHSIESHIFMPTDGEKRERTGGAAIVVMITDGREDMSYIRLLTLQTRHSPPAFFETADISACRIGDGAMLLSPNAEMPFLGWRPRTTTFTFISCPGNTEQITVRAEDMRHAAGILRAITDWPPETMKLIASKTSTARPIIRRPGG